MKWVRFYRLGELLKEGKDRNNATCLMSKSRNKEYFCSDVQYFEDKWPDVLERIKATSEKEKRVRVGYNESFGNNKELTEQVKELKNVVKRIKSVKVGNPLFWPASAKSEELLFVKNENFVNRTFLYRVP